MQGGVFLKKRMFVAFLCCALLAGCGADDVSVAVVTTQEPQKWEEDESTREPEQAPMAKVEGECLSPDGTYRVLCEGTDDNCINGISVPETLRIVNAASGEILWEDMSYLWQSALWSPDGTYLALAYAGRTWNQILFFETDGWTTWQFTLPDGGAIPEYTFLPRENWGTWVDDHTILLTVGEGGDAGSRCYYTCTLDVGNGDLLGSVTEEVPETLVYHYDFNHNGRPETVILEGNHRTIEESSFWGLNVWEDDRSLWLDTAATSHAGWNNLFALTIDGKDYLLRYQPSMWQGVADYHYWIFSLDEAGNEVILQENHVEFDTNFQSAHHQGFDPVEVAAFLEEISSYLKDSTVLLSTEHGHFSTGDSGAEFQEDGFFWDAFCPYDPSMTMEENVRNFQRFRTDHVPEHAE